jgi:hypothetical protein
MPPAVPLILPVAIIRHPARARPATVKLTRNRVRDIRQLLLLLLEVLGRSSLRVLLEPVGCFLDSFEDLLLISFMFYLIYEGLEALTDSLSSSSIFPPKPSSSLT